MRSAPHRATSRHLEAAEPAPPPRPTPPETEQPAMTMTIETDPMAALERLRASARARSQAAFNAIAGFDVDQPDRRGGIRWTPDGPVRLPDDADPLDLQRETQRRRQARRWNGPGAEEAALVASARPLCDKDGRVCYWPVGELHVIHPENKLAALMRDVQAQQRRWAEEKRIREEALLGEAK